MTGQETCTTPGCEGDGRYAAPGRGHKPGCRSPLDGLTGQETTAGADGRLSEAEREEIAYTFHGAHWLSPERAALIERIITDRIRAALTAAEKRRDDHAYWASVCICGMSEQERTGHYPEHEDWCEVPSPLDDDEDDSTADRLKAAEAENRRLLDVIETNQAVHDHERARADEIRAAAWDEGCLAVCNGGIDKCGQSEPHMHPESNPYRADHTALGGRDRGGVMGEQVGTFLAINADKPCGGIWTSRNDGPWKPPGCCEVHLEPWGTCAAKIAALALDGEGEQ